MPSIDNSEEVEYNQQEIERIFNLPVSELNETQLKIIKDQLHSTYRKPMSRMELRDIQVKALYECFKKQGLFAPIRVGGGKTLISLLLPSVMKSKKPLLIVPASLRQKTLQDGRILRKEWYIGRNINLISYETLARENQEDFLNRYGPDIIICDEAHYLKNKSTSASRRIMRYLYLNSKTIFVCLSGTMIDKSIIDYFHMMNWCLGKDKPLPNTFQETKKWSKLIDYNPKLEDEKRDPKFFRAYFGIEEKKLYREGKALSAIRQTYRKRLNQTSGVVSTIEAFTGSQIKIRPMLIESDEAIIQAFNKLKTQSELPDGMPIADGIGISKCAKELALGFYYQMNPRPPSDWLDVRRQWCSMCRKIIKSGRYKIDTEAQLITAFQKGRLKEGLKEYIEWKKIEKTFELKSPEAKWI